METVGELEGFLLEILQALLVEGVERPLRNCQWIKDTLVVRAPPKPLRETQPRLCGREEAEDALFKALYGIPRPNTMTAFEGASVIQA